MSDDEREPDAPDTPEATAPGAEEAAAIAGGDVPAPPPPPPVEAPVLPTVPPAAYPPPPPPPRLAPAWTPTVGTPDPGSAGSTPPSPAGSGGGRRAWLIVLGCLAIAGGLLAVGVMLAMRSSVEEDAVRDFARAPVGCTTTLEFDRTGTYTMYLETRGSLPELSGDCEALTPYEYSDDDLPRVNLTLVDADDTEVTLTPSSDGAYDTGSFVGTATATVDIDQEGPYRLTVTSDATEIAIAVGDDPSADSDALTTWAIVVGATALVVGVVLILLGLRRRRPRAASDPSAPPPSSEGWSQQSPVPGSVSQPPPPPGSPTGDASP